MKAALRFLTLGLLLTVPGYADHPPAADLLEGMGSHHRDVGLAGPAAQAFDQGLVLAYGFNHAAAERAFREAARLEPSCAMCYWGAALVLGPHINATMDPGAVPPAWEAVSKALALAEGAKPANRALIEALAQRYAADPKADRAALDLVYAEAMRAAARRYPGDADVVTLAAEALMDLHPWDLWLRDGTPQAWTGEILDLLEKALEVNPLHPGANHYYIHAVEASKQPGRGLAAADRLRDLVPGAGHLLHMPGHIYLRVGRYWDVIEANRRAVAADRKAQEAASCHGAGLYELAYVPHNPHFLWAAATLAGAESLATETARELASGISTQAMREPGLGTLQHYWATPLYSAVRFRRWEEILATSEPDADLVYPRGVWRWAQGLAHLAKGQTQAAGEDLAALERHAADPAIETVTIWDINTSRALLDVARQHLAGELALARGETDGALSHLRAAVASEDGLRYDEPPPWILPMRQMLGAALLKVGRAAEAEAVFVEDLGIYPENGWSLDGLAKALAVQGKEAAAAEARRRFDKAFERADVKLAGGR